MDPTPNVFVHDPKTVIEDCWIPNRVVEYRMLLKHDILFSITCVPNTCWQSWICWYSFRVWSSNACFVNSMRGHLNDLSQATFWARFVLRIVCRMICLWQRFLNGLSKPTFLVRFVPTASVLYYILPYYTIEYCITVYYTVFYYTQLLHTIR